LIESTRRVTPNEYSSNQELLESRILGVSQEWLEERILKGLARNDYEPKKY